MIAACDIADDLRDGIVEYQVGADAEKYVLDSSFMQPTVLAAGGNLWADLSIDRESRNWRFGEETLDAD